MNININYVDCVFILKMLSILIFIILTLSPQSESPITEMFTGIYDGLRISTTTSCINDDIYYYESDWLEKMQDYLTDGCTIYYQDFADRSYEFEEIIENVYVEYYNDKKQELEDKLIDDGYERESAETTTEMV